MNKPNSAGFYDYEDVPRDLYEEEVATTYKNFEDYLKEIHTSHNITDDEMPEVFEEWVNGLGVDILMLYAYGYGEVKKLEGYNIATN